MICLSDPPAIFDYKCAGRIIGPSCCDWEVELQSMGILQLKL